MAELTANEKAELRKAARDCDHCGEEAGTVELGSALLYCQNCFDEAREDAAQQYCGVPARDIITSLRAERALLRAENYRLEAEATELVRQAQDRETALAQGWAKLREEKRSIRELAWGEGRNSTDERNPYR